MSDIFDPQACIYPPPVSGEPVAAGIIRQTPEDFVEQELPVCEPDGEGEHVWVHVRKRNANTGWVADQLARCAAVPGRQVSYAGLKDRRAVTDQWFSVHLPGRDAPDWSVLHGDEIRILDSRRHSRKLRRGALRGNRFTLRIRDFSGDPDRVEARLHSIARAGFPNYFGPQRFGRRGANLAAAEAMFLNPRRKQNRQQRSLLLSAARSMLFNAVLAERVKEGVWNTVLAGELLELDGRRSLFHADPADPELAGRARVLEVHPTGPLWGRGELQVQDDCRALEQAVLDPFITWRAGLEQAGLEQDRRALRVRPGNLCWSFPEPHTLELSFSLPPGSYATVMLREFIEIK